MRFSDERGAYKRTYSNRFAEFDSVAISYLNKMQDNLVELSVHDVGVSDGRTALDFFNKIALNFSSIRYFASDYNPYLYVLSKGNKKLTLSEDGKVLEVLFPPFVFYNFKRDSYKHYPINHIIKYFVDKFFVQPLLKKYKDGLISPYKLTVVSPSVLKKASIDTRFVVGKHDLLKPMSASFNVIRAMNVLNNSYFSQTESQCVLGNIYNALEKHGLLVVGSNQSSGTVVDGGIYEKTDRGFQLLFKSGNGCQIDIEKFHI